MLSDVKHLSAKAIGGIENSLFVVRFPFPIYYRGETAGKKGKVLIECVHLSSHRLCTS